MTTIARNLVGSLEIQARAVPPQRVRYLGEDKNFSETSEKPLTTGTKCDTIRPSKGDDSKGTGERE